MQAIIFNDTIDNSDPILTGKRIQRHILKADFQEAGKDLTLFPVQIMPVHGNAAEPGNPPGFPESESMRKCLRFFPAVR